MRAPEPCHHFVFRILSRRLGGLTPNGINSALYGLFPNLAYDSWITIGQDDSNFPNPTIGSVGVRVGNAASLNFEAGGDFIVNDGVGGNVYVTPDQVQAQPDADGRVLLAQLTTTSS